VTRAEFEDLFTKLTRGRSMQAGPGAEPPRANADEVHA
jgi:hypothetical protein